MAQVNIYTLEIPKLLVKQITKRGYDVKSWLKSQLYEILTDVKQEKINDLIKDKTTEIEDHLKDIKDAIKVT